MSFTGKSPANTYKDITYVDNSNSGVTTTIKRIKTGEGSDTSALISDRALKVLPSTDNTGAFEVNNASNANKFRVDTTNNYVKALGHQVNTQYANFGVASGITTSYAANTHYPLAFSGNNQSAALQDNMTLGTSTDPATSFTTADGANTDASLVVPVLWFVPDNITIDQVVSFEGCDNATGGTTRMHLMSYDLTSGSTSCLTNGTLIAHNSDVTNAGSEQVYQSTWTVDSANVSGDKVLIATFLTTDVTGDYSVSVNVKYHLR